MRVVIQRVKKASVEVEQEVVGQIERGMLIFVCMETGDTENTITKAADKIAKLRIFDDAEGKINLNISQTSGEILSVSQFTLSWDGSSGHRPSFEKSMAPGKAKLKYALFNRELRNLGCTVKEGVFGAMMQVGLINDGPVTILLDF